MAFIIQNDARKELAVGPYGRWLGYGGWAHEPTRIYPSIAVEFDNYQNDGDPIDQHMGIVQEVQFYPTFLLPMFPLWNGRNRFSQIFSVPLSGSHPGK